MDSELGFPNDFRAFGGIHEKSPSQSGQPGNFCHAVNIVGVDEIPYWPGDCSWVPPKPERSCGWDNSKLGHPEGFYGFGEIREKSPSHSVQSGDFCRCDNIVGLAEILSQSVQSGDFCHTANIGGSAETPRHTGRLLLGFAKTRKIHRKDIFGIPHPGDFRVLAEPTSSRPGNLVSLGTSANPIQSYCRCVRNSQTEWATSLGFR